MKNFIILSLALLSVHSFAKGGGRVPSQRCEATKSKVIDTFVNEINKDAVFVISRSLWTPELTIEESDVVLEEIIKLDEKLEGFNQIISIHNVEKNNIGQLYTRILYQDKITFHKEEDVKGKLNCVWQIRPQGNFKIRRLDNNDQLSNFDTGSLRKVKIPLN